ncbi:hypothetical protein ACPTJI_32895, partial [Pseudomonas aeruginosa]|uniref:hypothetical protein n=1 Tax=Pseudomonas aeruginosa TaxID=287 RepID=UPI003CC5F42E
SARWPAANREKRGIPMKQFAKLFEFEDLGQVLVMLDRGDDGPEVRLYFKPNRLGVCSVACSNFPGDEDEQWDHAEKAFATVDSEGAHKLVAETMKVVPDRLG